MSLTTLIPRIVFGLKGDSKNNLQYTDDNTLLYPAGRNVIVYQTEQKSLHHQRAKCNIHVGPVRQGVAVGR